MKKGTRRYIEHEMQKSFMDWVRTMIDLRWHVAELQTMHSIPNGGERPKYQAKNGKWYCPEGQRLNQEGLKAGMPDLCLPVSRGPFIGAYIEMKAPGFGLSDSQKKVIPQLQAMGHAVYVEESVKGAVDCIKYYLALPRYELVLK
jgi:hypothetical protein